MSQAFKKQAARPDQYGSDGLPRLGPHILAIVLLHSPGRNRAELQAATLHRRPGKAHVRAILSRISHLGASYSDKGLECSGRTQNPYRQKSVTRPNHLSSPSVSWPKPSLLFNKVFSSTKSALQPKLLFNPRSSTPREAGTAPIIPEATTGGRDWHSSLHSSHNAAIPEALHASNGPWRRRGAK